MIIVKSDKLLKALEHRFQHTGWANIRRLLTERQAEKTKFGDDYKGRNEVVLG